MTLTLLPIVALCGVLAAEDLTCLKAEPGGPPPSSLFYAQLQKEAYAALDRRSAEYEKLKTQDDAITWQARRREFFVKQLGGFPERTPLNARVVGTLPADGYRIEKVIFESQPQHHVTANLYLPDGKGPFPGVLVSSGHSRTAKTADYNQRIAIMLARHGMAAFCYDPIGAGNAPQILTPEGKPQFNGTTTEHFLVGVGSILVGTNTARYRVWDGMRAIDYLTSRPDIDAKRIGMTGCSGGGTLTSYVMALDERVACAAPACYLTTFRRLIETIGPQDAEQNVFGQLAFGLDHPDYVLLRAPRALISSTTGDYFDIQGAWDNYRQAKRFYGQLGFPERVDLVEAPGGHGVQPTNLVGITRWMRRWLLDKDDAVSAENIVARPEAELLCTEKGQVLLSLPNERLVFDLNVEIEKSLAQRRSEFWKKSTKAEALAAVRQVVGVRPDKEIPPPKEITGGRVEREGYHIDKLVMETDSGVPLPALTFHPRDPKPEAYLYLHEDGKVADGAPGGPIEKLVKEGYVVVAVDLRGQGETAAAGSSDAVLGPWKSFYLAYLLGKSVVGMHTEDVLAARRFVADYKTKKPRKVHVVGVGLSGIPVLHAAALEPDLFATVTLRRSLPSWSGVVSQTVPAKVLSSTVHGALAAYDLPDLVRCIEPSQLRIEGSE